MKHGKENVGNDMADNDSGHRNEDLHYHFKKNLSQTESVKGNNNGMREEFTRLFSFSNLSQKKLSIIPFVYKF